MNFDAYIDLINSSLFTETAMSNKMADTVREAMEYSLSCGGKRIRPLFTVLFCEACGGKKENALPLACAIEYVHTYSLIHDDLPCMDNDDFRRGKPSCHKKFGESYALLAGDALLTLAFGRIAQGAENGLYSCETAVRAASALSKCAGYEGMIGGQAIDLSCEGLSVGVDVIRQMDLLKTSELIKAACVMGCLAAEASEAELSAACDFAEKTGLAFQITDDILDVTGNLQTLGKLSGSDAENDKSTYVKLLGLETCKEYVDKLTAEALNTLEVFPYNREMLRELALMLSRREK